MWSVGSLSFGMMAPSAATGPNGKSRFVDEQIEAFLRKAYRTSVAESANKHQASDRIISAWRKHITRLPPANVQGLKALQLQPAKLTRVLTEPEP